jgi:TPP-dependent pyruvate/acetoin dehydrogenase alpha subunit
MKKETKIKLYESMQRIRIVEEEIANRYNEGKMRCPTHLSIGQEAVPAAIGECLNVTDFAISTHRGHAHYIGKGGSVNRMIAEIYGKATGCSKGRGGSMHLIDLSVGFMGTSAIVGNSIPVGVGFALSAKILNRNHLSCVFFGDGATEEGAYYESVNFAVLKKLPVLFICENNFYSVYSPLKVRQPEGRSILKVAEALGAGVTRLLNGNDVEECHEAITQAVQKIRKGEGPQLLEFTTYRWREHCGPGYDNHIGYRSEEEYLEWKQKDPVFSYENKLVYEGILEHAAIATIKNKIAKEISEAFDFAENSPFPEVQEAFEGEYAQEL